MFSFDSERRYQECGPLEQLWRRRFLVYVPFRALEYWFAGIARALRERNPRRYEPARVAWSLARGLADMDMRHYHRWSEIKKKFRDEGGEGGEED